MGVNSINEKTFMKLKFKEKDLTGKEKIVSKSYTGLKAGVDNGKVYDLAMLIVDLQKKELESISKLEETLLTRA